jgi:hypothetical protein
MLGCISFSDSRSRAFSDDVMYRSKIKQSSGAEVIDSISFIHGNCCPFLTCFVQFHYFFFTSVYVTISCHETHETPVECPFPKRLSLILHIYVTVASENQLISVGKKKILNFSLQGICMYSRNRRDYEDNCSFFKRRLKRENGPDVLLII